MPETPEQLLALLEAPHWKTPGSTSRRPEGRTARQTEGQPAVNLTVIDHISAGRRVLAEAERIAAQGTTLALREAEALREAQRIKSKALMGETTDVRQITCPYCGAYGLLLHKGRAVCINLHCAPAGVQRNWAIVDLMMARPVQPRGVRRSETRPRDDRDLDTIVRFLKWTGHPMTIDQLRRIVRLYELPNWPSRLNPRRRAYSLSDVLTAHAVEASKKNPSDCAVADKPACSGLADAFFSEKVMGHIKVREAKALCEGCPFREPCLDTALDDRDELQHGVRGGLSSKERRELKTKLMPPRDRSKCLQGHELSGDNLRIRPDTNDRVCRECARAQRQKSRRKQKR
jgi:hypothetical protein